MIASGSFSRDFSERRERARKTLDIVMLAGALSVVFRHMRPGRNHMRRGISDTAKLDRPLGNEVDVVFDTFVDLIEELMQRDEVRPFDIPVRVFAMQLQINGLGEACVASFNELNSFRLR